jgi:site-specific recombinase XerD
LSPICVSRSNSLIFNFANKKTSMARSTFKVLFYVNGSKEKNGIVPIMGRVTINGSVAQFSCKQTIPKALWDAKGNRAKGKSIEARDINHALDNIKAQIIKHYQRISDREAYVTAEMVRNAYQGIGSEYETLLGAFDKDNATFQKRVGTDRVKGTYMARVRARNHVAAFIKANYKRSDLSMLELTPDFIKEFAVFLSTDRGLQNGSIWTNCMWLKGVVMRAHFNGLIPRNPFAQFHISPNIKDREYLTEEELKTLMTHEFADAKLSYIRDIFVFASFTALSFVDVKGLTTDDIVEVNGEKWILSKRHKTKVPFQVKLLDIPLQIIKRYEEFQTDKSVFPNLNYWSICKPLKKMIKECGITKDISFHCARHGFATLALSKGMPIESVSRVLGHTNIVTTQLYAKITTQKIDHDLTMFGDKLNQSFGNTTMA